MISKDFLVNLCDINLPKYLSETGEEVCVG